MYQKLLLIGSLGRDVEARYLQNGTMIANFSVATSRKWTDANGELKEETAWFRISAFGKLAETCNTYLSKGSKVLIEGELTPDAATGSPRVYTRKDGTSGSSYEVRANLVRFLTPKNGNNNSGSHDTSTGDVSFGQESEEPPF